MFSKIWASDLTDYLVDDSESRIGIELKKFNLFVGANNSGKSRLLRKLFASKPNDIYFTERTLEVELRDYLNKIFPEYHPGNIVNSSFISGDDMAKLRNGEKLTSQDYALQLNSIKNLLGTLLETQPSPSQSETGYKLFFTIEHLEKENEELKMSDSFFEYIKIPNRIYIPILRGMRPVATSPDFDSYLDRTNRDYFISEAGGLTYDIKVQEIFTGIGLTQLIRKFLLGTPQQREKIRKYEKLLGQEFFGGQGVTLVPELESDTLSIQFDDGEQRKMFNLGDGLQPIIILTAKAFLTEAHSIFFIEEPEQSLHPGLLRKLALFLLRKTEHQYFVTTHSNHLLDLTEFEDEVSVHRLTKKIDPDEKHEKFLISGSAKDREILNDLGVHPSSIFLSNSTIWVEGITDRFYIRCFMQKYLDEMSDEDKKKSLYLNFMENYHYSFVEYQGGTLGHWIFDDNDDSVDEPGLKAIKLCAQAILICDGDIRDKGSRYDTLYKQLQDKLVVLKEKELENIIPHNIIIATAKDVFSKRRKIKKTNFEIAKLDSLSDDHFLNEKYGIGYLLDKALDASLPGGGNKKGEVKIFADASGTIREKVEFCRKAIERMNTTPWELNSSINELCKRIFEHIEDANPS